MPVWILWATLPLGLTGCLDFGGGQGRDSEQPPIFYDRDASPSGARSKTQEPPNKIRGSEALATVSLWSRTGDQGQIQIFIDGSYQGTLDSYFYSAPNLGQEGTLTVQLSAGAHAYEAVGTHESWAGTFELAAGDKVVHPLQEI